jgi:phosphoribosylamine---glycine ligase
MEKVGILVVSYGSREAAIADALSRSSSHRTELYIVDKQRNPFNVKKAKEHVVVPDLNISEIARFVNKRKDRIDFGIVGPEKPIIEGVRNLVERQTKVPLICPTKEYAIEASKVAQRLLFEKVAPQANPRFKIFRREDYTSIASLKKHVYSWLDILRDQAVVKPDRPAAGKGVGVWGDHFNTREQLFEHFVANYQQGPVIVEEKVDGEESSFQAFCDGRHLVPLPETRDYKRAFDDDHGPNTGGMGCYKDTGDILPFMTEKDKEKETELINRLFKELRKKADADDLRGIPFYSAFIHTAKGPKILEINSRPGDPEIQCLLPVLKDDFVDICYSMLEGNIKNVSLENKASVVVYKAPPTYGGYIDSFAERANQKEVNTPIDLSEAEKLSADPRNIMHVYPGSMELREDGLAYALSSRAVCVVGVSDSIEEARETSLIGVRAIKGGALWYRNDIASKEHVSKSIEHINLLRTRGK